MTIKTSGTRQWDDDIRGLGGGVVFQRQVQKSKVKEAHNVREIK